MKHKLYFVRHGETDWNKAGRFQGQSDIPLNDTGRGQAKGNGAKLRDLLSHDNFKFLASPLSRTRETMEIIRGELGIDINDYQTDPQLMEINFGDYEGIAREEYFSQTATEREKDPWHFKTQNGESYADISKRVKNVLDQLDQDTVMVAHGVVWRVVRGYLLDLSTEEIIALPTPQDKVMYFHQGEIAFL